MSVINFLFGRPLASSEEQGEKIGPGRGIGVFGMDALGSAVYGPEAALTILIPLGAAGLGYILPVTILIVIVAALVFFSYNQTIKAYPQGGGTYTVATENLGQFTGMIAGASLMIDYVLVVAVGISAGIGTLVSVFPNLQSYRLLMCLGILLILTLINLRGIGESGTIFMMPAYLFIASMLIVLGIGIVKTIATGGNPHPAVNLPLLRGAGVAYSYWLFLKAFSNGSTAMTGIEAVSNGVPVFREPVVRNARITLAIIIVTLVIMLIMIAVLCKVYSIGAVDPDSSDYKSVLYMLVVAVIGNGWISYIPVLSILLIVIFQANTSFSGFPRLCSVAARNGHFPGSFAERGRRLVFTSGIVVLSLLSAVILIIFGGVTDRLIPLFAFGALTAFTLSQAGMVFHWKKSKERHRKYFMAINGLGMTATGITSVIVLVTKFTSGAWILLILIPLIVMFMSTVYRHYEDVKKQLHTESSVIDDNLTQPLIVLPALEWNNNTLKALRFALTISDEIIMFHVTSEEKGKSNLEQHFKEYVEDPLKEKKLKVPVLEVYSSPYRQVIRPIVDYVLDLEKKRPDRNIAILIPNLIEKKWYHRFLHNHSSILIAALLFRKDGKRTSLIYVPWHLKKDD